MSDDVPAGLMKTKRKWYHYLRWGDYLLYALILALSGALFLGSPLLRGQEASAAIVTMDGDIVKEIPFAELQQGGEFDLEAYGYHYHFEYENGKIRFADADCPDLVCVRTGWISHSGELAACVPGHLILRLQDGDGQSKETDDVDVIVR